MLNALSAKKPRASPCYWNSPNVGVESARSRRDDKAPQLYRLFVDLYPRDVMALNLLGDLYRDHHQTAKAVVCYKQSLAIKPGNGGAVDGLREIEKKWTGAMMIGVRFVIMG